MPFNFGSEATQQSAQAQPQAQRQRFNLGDTQPQQQGASGFGALQRGLARGVRGFGQLQEQLGIPSFILPRETEQNIVSGLERTARQPLAPGVGPAVLSGIGEAIPSIAALGPAGFATTGAVAATALGAAGGGLASAARFREQPPEPGQIAQEAIRGVSTGGVVGAAGGSLMRLLRGEKDLFQRASEIAENLGMRDVITTSKPSRSIIQFIKTAEREDPVFLDLLEKSRQKAPVKEFQRVLKKQLSKEGIEKNLKQLERSAWAAFDSQIKPSMPVNLGPAAAAARDALKRWPLTGGVGVKARRIISMQERGTPTTFKELRGLRQDIGDLFNTQRVVETVPDKARNILYRGLTESMRTVFNQAPGGIQNTQLAARGFDIGNKVSSKVALGRNVLKELGKTKGPRNVRNFLINTKKLTNDELDAALGVAPELKELRDLASIIVAPSARVVRPIARGSTIPVGTQALAVGSGTAPEQILGAGAVGADFLRQSFGGGQQQGPSIQNLQTIQNLTP